MSNRITIWKARAIQLGLVASLLSTWEIGASGGWLDSFHFSSPSRVAHHAVSWIESGILTKHLLITLAEAGVGFFTGLMAGMIVGFLIAGHPTLDLVLQPFLGIANAMPRIAFAPLLVLWFGFGFLSKVILVVSLVFFVVFYNTYRGFKEIRPVILKNARVLGASKNLVLLHIYLPATLAWIFTSLRICVGFSIIGAILGEYIGSSAGIGFLIDNAQSNFDATGVMTGLAVLTAVVVVVDSAVKRVETHFLKWQPDPEKLQVPAT